MNTLPLMVLISLLIGGCSFHKVLMEKKSFEFNCDTEKSFYFINGVNVSLLEAKSSARRLSNKFGVEFKTVYNSTEGILNDVIQAFHQKKKESPDKFIDINSMILDSFLIALKKGSEIYSQEEIGEIQRVVDASREKHTLILAHSQGNLFANEICERAEIKPISIQVANPSSIKTKCEKIIVSFDNDPVLIAISGAAKATGMNHLSPRTPNDRFEKGIAITSALRERVERAIIGENESINGLFYNHEFTSYLFLDDSSSSKISRAIKSEIPKKDKVAFHFSINEKEIVPQVLTSSWGSGGKSVMCSEIKEDGGYITLSPSLSRTNQLLIKIGNDQYAIKRLKGAMSVSAIIEKKDEKGNYIIRSVSVSDVLKRFVGID